MAPAGDGPQRKRGRLSRSGEFERVYREGRSHASRHLVVYTFPRAASEGDARLGISVGRKVGGAVERSRVKRLLRECFWECAQDLPAGHDFVVVARPEAGKLVQQEGGSGFRSAMQELLDGAGLGSKGSR